MTSVERHVLLLSQRALSRLCTALDARLGAGPVPAKEASRTLAHAYQTGWQDYPAVFVLSTGRGGTETLAALAALSPVLAAEHEPRPRLVKASYDAYLAGPTIARQQEWLDLVLASRDEAVWSASRWGRTYVETNNRLTYLAPVLAKVFPASRFIHVYREPFAFVRSAMRRRYYMGHDWDFARLRPKAADPILSEWATWSAIERCAWLWRRTNADALDWMDTLPHERRMSIRAEDLFRGDMDVVQSFFTFCGSKAPDGSRLTEVLGARINEQRHGSYPEVARWPAEDIEMVRRQVAVVAERLGYALPELTNTVTGS